MNDSATLHPPSQFHMSSYQPTPKVAPRWDPTSPWQSNPQLQLAQPRSTYPPYIPQGTAQFLPPAPFVNYTAPRVPPKQHQDYYTPRVPGSFPAMGLVATPSGADMPGNAAPLDDHQWPFSSIHPSRSPPRRGKSQKKTDGKQPTFLTKLYADAPEYHHIIRWDESGDLIIVEKPEELQEKVLPLVYRQTRFASFSRQLNIYGWMRKVSLRHVESGIVDPDASTWSHQTLRRDSSKEEILSFKRRVPPRPSQAQKNAAKLTAEGLSVSSDSEGLQSPAPDVYSTHTVVADLDVKPMVEPLQPETTHAPALEARRLSAPTGLRPALPITSLAYDANRPYEPRPAMQAALFASSYPGPTVPAAAYRMGDMTLDMTKAKYANLSPASAFNSLNIWLQEDVGTDPPDVFQRNSSDEPTFQIDDASTWARCGEGILGMRTVEPAPLNPSSDYFAFGSFSASAPYIPPAPQPAFETKSPMFETKPSVAVPEAPAHQPAHQTVSPGVYQSGFMQWGSPQTTPSPPQVTPQTPHLRTSPATTKPERRLSHSKPYVSPGATTPSGPVRNVGDSRRNSASDVRRNSLQITTRSDSAPFEDDVPSASLAGQPELFGGELDSPALDS